MAEQISLTGQQLLIMEALWSLEAASVAQVRDRIASQKRLAPTTVATVLKRLEKRNLVTHEVSGRQYVYRPAVPRQEVRRTSLRAVLGRVFQGNSTALVSQLLRDGEISTEELDDIKRLVDGELARRTEKERRV